MVLIWRCHNGRWLALPSNAKAKGVMRVTLYEFLALVNQLVAAFVVVWVVYIVWKLSDDENNRP